MQLKVNDKAPNFTFNSQYAANADFYQTLGAMKARRAILLFSRYVGCSLCQLKLMETVRGYPALAAAGADLLFFMQSTPENALSRLAEMGVKFTVVMDPEQDIYELYQVGAAATKEEMLSAAAMDKVREARGLGIVHGAYEGNELQLPALFIVDRDARVLYAHYGKDGADLPGNEELLAILGKLA